jgi:hypothetical protein
MSIMTKKEWMEYIENTWNAAKKEAWAEHSEREWVALTDDEISDVIDDVLEGGGWLDVARALEAAIKEKNSER